MADGKKSGKKNGKTAAPQVETNQADETKNDKAHAKNGVFLNNVSEKMVRLAKHDDDTYYSVSIGLGNGQDGKPIYGSVLVREGQVLASTKRGKDGAQVDNPGFKNIVFKNPNQKLKVSTSEKDANGEYIQKDMTAAEFVQTALDNRKAYKDAKKAAQKTVDVPEVAAEADGPEMGE